MTGYLVAEEGPLAGMTIRLENESEWVLGRDPDEVSIVLEDPMVSRRHVICRLTQEGYVLENLSSVNPATQNGKVITESVLLKEGDIVQIGSTFFRFSEQELAEPPLLQDELSEVSFGSPLATRWLLKVISGPNAGAEFSLEEGKTYLLGKDPSLNDVIFNDLSVSRQHARLSVDEQGHVYIQDLGSRNGLLVNGHTKLDQTELSSQDLVALGTTSFLMIDTQLANETIFSAPSIKAEEPSEKLEILEEASPAVKKDWREMIIPTKHIVVAGGFCLVLLGLVASTFSLFHTNPIEIHIKNEKEQIKESLTRFNDIQYTFNESTGKLFLLGHVLTQVEKQELLYCLGGLSFITSVEDNVVIDEYVWQNMNALLLSNPGWQMVSIHSPQAGKFVMKGYVETIELAENLAEYINVNFPYLDRLQNNVVVENNLNLQIQGLLLEKGLSGVNFQLIGGDLVLSGKVDDRERSDYKDLLAKFKALPGIREVKSFVVVTTMETSRIDLSKQYQVSGYSQGSDDHFFVVVNGKVLSIGDALDGMLITNIQSTMILLEKDGLKFRINYNLQ